jgi:hypothetical protein
MSSENDPKVIERFVKNFETNMEFLRSQVAITLSDATRNRLSKAGAKPLTEGNKEKIDVDKIQERSAALLEAIQGDEELSSAFNAVKDKINSFFAPQVIPITREVREASDSGNEIEYTIEDARATKVLLSLYLLLKLQQM